MRKTLASRMVVLLFVVLCGAMSGSAQDVGQEPSYEVQMRSSVYADINSLVIDTAVTEAVSRQEVLFIIARPGRGERGDRISRRRLARIACYIESAGTQPKTLLAVGEPVAGAGRIEFYVGGKPVLVLDRPGYVYAWRNRFFRLYETETPTPQQRRCNSL